ncbi:hypothetical protein [Alistipes dispar]|uniref:hypothetical protein n=1 Tax=Alistipes dispar TaxID=2585119 RepID=UPI00248C00B9|nr:hypothetical protein [Alistipes dispar]
MTKLLAVDWLLVLFFAATAWTGVALHLAGHAGIHEVWHGWAVAHVLAAAGMLGLTGEHVRMHRGWYGVLLTRGVGRKRLVTAVLTLLFTAVSATGIALLGVDGAGSAAGLWHYGLGLGLSALSAWHIAFRAKVLAKIWKKRK